ncbi:MAG: H/ACA snoRNP pseudouridylase subunit [Candelina submexicana]|nr:MAG: H/ACA snoRNP pseudouridylase subunit [Candelina submexicana]
MSFRGSSRGRGGNFGGSARGGGGGGGSFGGRGGRGGFHQSYGPPAAVLELGSFVHACEGEMVCESVNPKIPYFNAPIYLENKTAIGKVDEILGPLNQVYFTIKPQEGIVATSFKSGDKFYIGGDKLLPLEKYAVGTQQIENSANSKIQAQRNQSEQEEHQGVARCEADEEAVGVRQEVRREGVEALENGVDGAVDVGPVVGEVAFSLRVEEEPGEGTRTLQGLVGSAAEEVEV